MSSSKDSGIGFFERWLTAWVALCIVAGTALGQLFPGSIQSIAALEIAKVNLPVGVLIWAMIVPMLMKIDFASLHEVRSQKTSIAITLAVNWIVKPFSMALFGWLFIKILFADWLPANQLDSYMAGLILLGAAPCTAMVFVWSHLCRGHAAFTLSQVALNDLVMVFAFAPIVGLLLGVSSIPVPWDTLLLSVLIYILIPLAIAQTLRAWLKSRSGDALQAALEKSAPYSMFALLATLVLLFAFQGGQILAQPMIIALLAVPILVQTAFIAVLSYWLNWQCRVRQDVAAPSTLIGTSNFFELAVAVAIVLYGLDSGAALATVVGVLIEVPVMLVLVRLINAHREHYRRRGGA
ncbi:MAG TPA: ACR3 family arsenite efflux transporter [Aquimonas sp.]|nr:ACR3 family arsenite efflux transporter [Aquimonas sp.]